MDQIIEILKRDLNSLKDLVNSIDRNITSLQDKNKEINDPSDNAASSLDLYEQVAIYDEWIEVDIAQGDKVFCVLSPDHDGVLLPNTFLKDFPLNIDKDGIFKNFTFKIGGVSFTCDAQVSDDCPLIIVSSSYLKRESIYLVYPSLNMFLIYNSEINKYEALEIKKLGATNPDIQLFIKQCNSEPDLISLAKKLFTESPCLHKKLHEKPRDGQAAKDPLGVAGDLKGTINKRGYSETFSQEE